MKRVVAFISRLEQSRRLNLEALIERAKSLLLEGFEAVDWDSPTWLITSGILTRSPGKRPGPAEINFCYHESLGGASLKGAWGDLAKALMRLRFHRGGQTMANQRSFVTAVAFVSHMANGREVFQLNSEILDRACDYISELYSESTAYNLHKAIMEFARYCDANCLCNAVLKYKYVKFTRPANAHSRQQRRLEDVEHEITISDKMVDVDVLRALGVLYQKVPSDHKYRLYVVMLTFLAFLGRRFSELAMLPQQEISKFINGELYIRIFPGKARRGDSPDPMERVAIPTRAEEIIADCLDEFRELSRLPRETAIEMRRKNGADLRFLSEFPSDYIFYKEDFLRLGFPDLVGVNGWIRKQGLTTPDPDKLTSQGIRPAKPSHYATRDAFVAYCQSLFDPTYISCLKKDGQGRSYFPEDMMILRFMGTSSGAYTPCIALPVTHAMLHRFINHDMEFLVREYHAEDELSKITSHKFRHTLNTVLDEGGLSELIQTRWFNRSNPRDTKAYQHTSPEKRAMIYREQIKLGEVGGPIADIYESLPIERRDAFLIARVKAVHDLGPGMCTHSFSQVPCPKGRECQSNCDEYSWLKESESARDEVIRMYRVQIVHRETAKEKYASKRKGASEQWLSAIEQKINVLERQLADFKVDIQALKKETLFHAG
ncbi:TPA: integrase [Pseudomonas aeruginosa]|nr:integrase [Pseudomonas aeruginosa]HEP8928435.1 integrase [Pseudomonas aeruginosa]